MNYQTFEPTKNLNPFVKCYWILESPKDENPERQKIVPDGCMEMIFHYGDLYKQHLSSEKSIIQPRSFVFGQLSEPLEIEPTGKIGIFAVRFHPDGFIPFSNQPIKNLENKANDLEHIFGDLALELSKKIINSKTTTERIAIIEDFLMKYLANTETIDRVIKISLETMLNVNGQLTVNNLTDQIKVDTRKLQRKFASTIGLSPKQLAKIFRLQAALKKLSSDQKTKLVTAAHDSEYYDQSHFIKDFKEFTGQTPKEFYGENFKMSLLFSEKD